METVSYFEGRKDMLSPASLRPGTIPPAINTTRPTPAVCPSISLVSTRIPPRFVQPKSCSLDFGQQEPEGHIPFKPHLGKVFDINDGECVSAW